MLPGMLEPVAKRTRPEPSWHGADPTDRAYLEDPYPVYRRLREQHPVSLTPDGVWRLTRYDDCLRMLRLAGAGMRRTDGTLPGQTPQQAAEERGHGLAFVDEVRTHGHMRHVRLGIDAKHDNDAGDLPSVVRVTRVDRDGPCDKASIEVDDLILGVNGRPISRVSQLAYQTQLAGVGAEVTFTIMRAASNTASWPSTSSAPASRYSASA